MPRCGSASTLQQHQVPFSVLTLPTIPILWLGRLQTRPSYLRPVGSRGVRAHPSQHLRTQVEINPRNLRAQMNSQNCFQNFFKAVSLHSPELLGSKASTTMLTPWLLIKGPLDNCFLVQAGSHEGSLGFMGEVVEPQDRSIATALLPNPHNAATFV